MPHFNSSKPPSQSSHGTPTPPKKDGANESDAEMSNFFLKDVLGREKEKVRESYKQKSPLAELLYTRWIEGLRERWPAI
jgi:hypothetical protein